MVQPAGHGTHKKRKGILYKKELTIRNELDE